MGVNERDALAVIRIHRTLSGPRPIVNPLARLIGVTVALYSDGTVEEPLSVAAAHRLMLYLQMRARRMLRRKRELRARFDARVAA